MWSQSPEQKRQEATGSAGIRQAGAAIFLVRSLPNGGLERVLLAQCAGARAAGWSPRVLCLEEPGALAPRFREEGVPVEALDLPRSGPLAAALALPRLLPRLRALRPAFVQVHMRRAGTLGRLAARLLGIPTVVALHNQDPPAPLWLRLLEGHLDAGSRFLAVSHAVRLHAARQRGLDPRTIPVLPNPLPRSRPARPGPIGSTPRIGFLGKLEGKKDPVRFLDAAAALAGRLPGLEVVVAGDGPLLPELRARARGLGLGVDFRGSVADGGDFLAALDLACFPSRREGFGLAVGEALSRGVPVVLSDIAPFREVYGRLPEACFLPPGATPEELADRCAALLCEPALRSAIHSPARRILEEHDPARTLRRYARYYGGLGAT